MDSTKTTLERAFELAASGNYDTVAAVKRQLRTEHLDMQQVQGRALSTQLRGIIHNAIMVAGKTP